MALHAEIFVVLKYTADQRCCWVVVVFCSTEEEKSQKVSLRSLSHFLYNIVFLFSMSQYISVKTQSSFIEEARGR